MFHPGVDPARARFDEILSASARAMRSEARRWIPIVFAIGIANQLVVAMIGDPRLVAAGIDATELRAAEPTAAIAMLAPLLRTMALEAAVLAGAIMVAGWSFTALAVDHARARRSGLRAGLLASLRSALAAPVTFALVGVPTVALGVAGALLAQQVPELGSLLVFAVPIVALAAVVHLSFVTVAIFDGDGPVGAIRRSVTVVRGDAWRIFGHLFAAGLIGIVGAQAISLTGSLVPLAGSADFADGIGAAVAAVFVAFFGVALYLSAEARRRPADGEEATGSGGER